MFGQFLCPSSGV